MKIEYSVYVKYNAESYFNQSDNFEYDEAIEKLDRKAHCGSGMGMYGKRDNHFVVNSYAKALRLAKRARALKIKGLGRVTATIHKDEIY